MRFSSAIVAAILGFAFSGVLAAPVPQLAGEGDACDSVLTDTDSGVGYGTESAEDNTANTVSSSGSNVARLRRRQLAGEGSACGSVLTDTDSGVGYGTENAEDNTANTVSKTKGGSKLRRQLDKIAKGAQTLSNSAGTGAETEQATTTAVDLDGTSTGDAAAAGAEVGSAEESTLEQAGSTVPKRFRRQLDKISKGAQTLSNAAGTGAETSYATTEGVNVDGQATGDAATAGSQVGGDEETTLEQAGSDAP